MKITDAYNDPTIVLLEEQIIESAGIDKNFNEESEVIKSLLEMRQRRLNELFESDEENHKLLVEYNDAISQKQLEAARQTIETQEALQKLSAWSEKEVQIETHIEFTEYPESHPVQTKRAHQIWDILVGGDYDALYSTSGATFTVNSKNTEPLVYNELEILKMDSPDDNWNEDLDREWSKDMHLTSAFHNSASHLLFALYDLLYLRDFKICIHIDIEEHADNGENYEMDTPIQSLLEINNGEGVLIETPADFDDVALLMYERKNFSSNPSGKCYADTETIRTLKLEGKVLQTLELLK